MMMMMMMMKSALLRIKLSHQQGKPRLGQPTVRPQHVNYLDAFVRVLDVGGGCRAGLN